MYFSLLISVQGLLEIRAFLQLIDYVIENSNFIHIERDTLLLHVTHCRIQTYNKGEGGIGILFRKVKI